MNITPMKTISEQEFFEKFMKISQDLTYSEIRMLYLIITEPIIIDLPQEKFAKRINTHRRTINIGLKKLRELNYIYESSAPDENERVNRDLGLSDDAILLSEKDTAKKVVIASFKEYYGANRKNYIVHEDYFYFILGDIRLHENYRYNKSFIIDTIREIHPKVRFHFDLAKSDYNSIDHYFINRMVNSEIIKAKNDRFYGIKTEVLLQKINDNFSIEKEEALNIIKKAFPKIRITEKHIKMRRPFKGVKSY